MPETHQTTAWIDRDISLERGAAREYQVNSLPLFSPANRLIHHQLSDGEAVVYFRHLHVLRGQTRITQCLSRCCGSCIEAEEVFDLPQRVCTETIRTHLDTLGE